MDADATDCSTLHLSLLRPQGIFFFISFFGKKKKIFFFGHQGHQDRNGRGGDTKIALIFFLPSWRQKIGER